MWFVLPLLLATLLASALALFVWRRRHAAPGGVAFSLLMLAIALWSLGYAGELVSMLLSAKLAWIRLQYLAIVAVPVLWFCFAWRYTHPEAPLRRGVLVALGLPPLLTCLLVWSNAWHGLIWQRVGLRARGDLLVFDPQYGPAFWLHVIYAYALLLAGSLLLIRALLRAPGVYRHQAGALLLGALLPWLGNLLYVLDIDALQDLDPTPFGFVLTGLVFAWGLFRSRLLDLVPLARDAVIERMTDGVIVVDRQRRIVDLNPAAAAVLGRGRAEVVGRPLDALLGLQDALDWQALTTTLREIDVGAAGRRYELRISPLVGRYGRLGAVVLLSDITERRRAEEARVLLAQEQAARAQAEEAIRARDAFLALVAHELKTPLTTLLGYADVLRRRLHQGQRIGAREQHNAQAIFEQACRLNRLIAQLLDLSRIQAGRLVLDRRPLDLSALLQRLVAELEPMLERHTLQLSGADRPLWIVGDELRLEQVIHNLLHNAVKYSPYGGLIQVCLEQQNGSACLTVSDQGIGIPQQALPHLFERFFRADNAQALRIQGLGIGLYVVRDIVVAHGGTIDVRSSVGVGSSFIVRLPLWQASAGESADRRQADTALER